MTTLVKNLARIYDPDSPPPFGTVVAVPWTLIDPDPDQPRNTDMSEMDYARYVFELAQNIRDNGQLQPIAIRHNPEQSGRFIIIAGESRWRAVQVIPQDTIAAIAYDVTESEAMNAQMLENVVRRDLNPIEQATGYKRFIDSGSQVADIARVVSKQTTHVVNYLALLNLPESTQDLIARGQLSVTVGFRLSTLDVAVQDDVLDKMNRTRMSVRETLSYIDATEAARAQSVMLTLDAHEQTTQERVGAETFTDMLDTFSATTSLLDSMERADPGITVRSLWPHRFRAMAELDRMEKKAKRIKELLSSEAAAQMAAN